MFDKTKRFAVAAAAAGAICGLAMPASAQDASAFYKGKTVTIVVTAGAGGSYGLYAQILARHWGKHLPGKPTVVPQYFGGSGGLKGSNYVHNVAPRDGTYVCMPINTVPMRQFLRPKGVKYDIRKWNWIGNMAVIAGTLGVWHTAGVRTIADAEKKQVILGATGFASTTTLFPKLLNSQLGTKFKLVMGYKGVATMDKAMLAGEIQGRTGSWTSWKSRRPEWIRDKKVSILLQVAEKRSPDLPDVPTLNDLAKTDVQRAMFGFMTASQEFGRSVFAPPGVPRDRVDALRSAFDATMKDPALIADLKTKDAIFTPMNWRDVETLAKNTATVDPKILNDLRKAVGLTGRKKGSRK